MRTAPGARSQGMRRARGAGRVVTLALLLLAMGVGAFVSSIAYRWIEGSGTRSGDVSDTHSERSVLAGPGARDGEADASAGTGVSATATDPAPRSGEAPDPGGLPPEERARIRIEVLNGAGVPGLADRMTSFLRERGYDVVNYGNASGARGKPTVILDRLGNSAYAREVALALPGTPIRTELSPDGFIDVTVVVGSDYERFLEPSRDLPSRTERPARRRFGRVREALGF